MNALQTKTGGGVMDAAKKLAKGIASNHLPDPTARDWHAQRNEAEPRCAADQWRQRDRSTILFISEMSDRHISHCVRFASTKPQHQSRLSALLSEQAARLASQTGSRT